MESRIPFVKEVAKNLIDHHEKEGSSYIFGISGKWGEGKTHFLNDLKNEIKKQDSSFEFFDINPWKFSADKTAFLRDFLKTLYKKCDPEDQSDLNKLDVDVSESEIHWGRLIKFAIILGLACWAFSYGPLFNFIMSLSDSLKFFFSVLLIPIVLAGVQGVVTTEKTDHAITTLDQFDELLEKFLSRFKAKRKKAIVFVDDLDRVTPSVARDVLDNLRTFFDKKEITFVVTGDHTVLEGYLGRDLLPEESAPAQLEEGRRFLKKIFNVYWRLPLPIKKEVRDFIDELFKQRAENISAFFPEEQQKESLANYLSKYFENNFRQIIRFLDTTLFNFQIIKLKAEEQNSSQAQYFKDMLSKPLLVVRILIIQELCTPLFDKMVTDVGTLQSLEYAVEKKDTPKVTEIVHQSDNQLSPSQRNFIERFIYEEPRFYRDSSLQVLGLQPYLSLAADVSFGDQRGPSSEDFMSTLQTGDPKGIKNDLLSMGEIKAKEAASAFSTQLPTMGEPVKMSVIRTLLVSLLDLPAESPLHKIFANKLSPLDYAFINNSPAGQKMSVLNVFFQWLDVVGDEATLKPFEQKFSLRDVSEFNAITFDNAGNFKSLFVSKWLKTYYPTQKPDALSAMTSHFPKLKLDKVQEQIDEMSDQLTTDLIQDSATQQREQRYSILKEYTTKGPAALKPKIFERIGALDSGIMTWAIAKISEEKPLWTMDEIQAELLNKLQAAPEFNALNQTLRFIINSKLGTPETIWPRLLPDRRDMFVDNLSAIIEDASLQEIAPPQAYASQLMDAVIEKIEKLDENEQSQWLGYVVKGKWPWVNLEKYPITTKLKSLKKSKNEDVKKNLAVAEDSWSETPKKESGNE